MKLIIEIPEKMYHMINAEFYDYGDMNIIIRNGTPLDKLSAELYDYITHSPYIKSFMDCCRLRDDLITWTALFMIIWNVIF